MTEARTRPRSVVQSRTTDAGDNPRAADTRLAQVPSKVDKTPLMLIEVARTYTEIQLESTSHRDKHTQPSGHKPQPGRTPKWTPAPLKCGESSRMDCTGSLAKIEINTKVD